MRFRIDVDLRGEVLTLPLNYREMVQAIIYHAMPEEEANCAHQQIAGRKKFQKFTFSRLFGKSKINMVDKTISFRSLSFQVSCCDDDLACQMVINLSKGICIYRQVYSVKITLLQEELKGYRIKMLSPLVARRTNVEDGKVSYLVPNHMDFAQAIYKNLCWKYQYFYGEDYKGEFALLGLPETLKGTNAKFENLYIKGYMGTFYLIVEPRALELLYKIGLGEKNAQGFGMFEMEE